MRKGLALLLSAWFCTLLLGCSHTISHSPAAGRDPSPLQVPDPHPTLRVWSWYNLDYQVEVFHKKHPDIQVEVTVLDYQKAHNEDYLKAIASHNPPDVFMIDGQQFGRFNSFLAFDDLNSPEYNLSAWKSVIADELWSPFRSFDGTEQLAIPYFINPVVAFYRADILQQYGFPTDPKELGDYMQDPKNWLHMAEVLQAHDRWISQWQEDPIQLAGLNRTYFGDQLHFVRTTKKYLDAYAVSRKINQENLSLQRNIGDDKGKEAIRQGRYAMLYLGSWAEYTLKDWAPDTEGKWRVTRLPFGLYGSDTISSFAISAESKHKKEAWDFITLTISDQTSLGEAGTNVFAYTPARRKESDMKRTSPFLGGQRSHALFEDLADHQSAEHLTPLDQEASKLWLQAFYENIGTLDDPKKALEIMAQNVDTGLRDQKESILKLWGESP